MIQSEQELAGLIRQHVGPDRVPRKIAVKTDTSDYFGIDYDDVVLLDGHPYLVRNNEREGRFGIDDEQKFWVKRVIDLLDGSTKIMKLTFHERFLAKVGGLSFECYRSPQKEGRILELTRDHPAFMKGIAREDSAGNLVRVVDYIRGTTLADVVPKVGSDHEDYFHNYLPSVMDEFVALVEAIGFLHDNGEKHGDIRRDHIIKERETGLCRWIDFDYNYLHHEKPAGYDLFGLGNVFSYIVGRGDVTLRDLKTSGSRVFDSVTENDVNIIFNNRLLNLRLVFPYIPEALNRILLRFSTGATVFYSTTDEFLDDLKEARQAL